MLPTAISLSLLVHCFGTLQPLYTMTSTIHVGIAFCIFLARIACLVSHLHAGIVCLAFLACDWLFLIGAYPRVSVVSLVMIGGYL